MKKFKMFRENSIFQKVNIKSKNLQNWNYFNDTNPNSTYKAIPYF